jgi:hypothetical protein
MYRTTFLYYFLVAIPLLSFVVYPASPEKVLESSTELIAISSISIYISCMAVLGLWLSVAKKWRLLQSASSIGLFAGFSIFPMFILLFFLAGPVILGYLAVAGSLHGFILKKVHHVKLST